MATGNPEYDRVFMHYTMQGASEQEAARLAGEWVSRAGTKAPTSTTAVLAWVIGGTVVVVFGLFLLCGFFYTVGGGTT